MAERKGAVWFERQRVGGLREDQNHTLWFRYDDNWLDGKGFPISVGIPLSNGDREVDAHAFFEGLLPEGNIRRRLCRERKIPLEDDAGLLFAIGEDCAGALSVLPGDRVPEDECEVPARLPQEEIDRLVRSHGAERPSTGRQRFSLAGVQEKQPVIYDGEHYGLPDHLNPSSHILKFETISRVCFAEFIASSMARHIGLPVVDTEFLRIDDAGGTPFLRIKRYDRLVTGDEKLRRLHQEDVIQALGLPSLMKYQSDGGPGIGDVAEILRAHTARPLVALERLRDWQIFNYLAGNWDGHGKNLALLYLPEESVPVLAPFYDLVAIEFFNLVRPHTWARDTAFYIGSQNIPEKIKRSDWEDFARDLRMPLKRVLARIEELAGLLPDAARKVRREFAGQFGDEQVYDYLEESVASRCRWLQQTVFS